MAPSRLTRREFLAAGAAGAAWATAGCAAIPTAPPAPARAGPPVWLGMDQATLDAAYNQADYAPNLQQITGRYATNSDDARARLGPPVRYAYGDGPNEGLDVYVTDRPGATVNVFLHGGAWRTGRARDYAFPAELFARAGAHLVVPDFDWVQDVGGNLAVVAEQVRRAVGWVYRNAERFGGDPGGLFVAGHSSGAHLAAVALTTDWRGGFGLPADLLKGGLCCSGLYDLRPVRLSARSRYVSFTDELEAALSPQRHIDRIAAPVVVAYGTLETPEFQRQAREFAASVSAAGKPVRLLVGEGYNHFEVIETLANPYALLGRAVLEQMRLGRR